MKIFSYYQPIPNFTATVEQGIISAWRQSWIKHGWEPEILNESHARSHPLFESYLTKINQYPIVHPRDYMNCCFLRWLAFDSVGGGYMADYDLINYGFKPPSEKIMEDEFYLYQPCTPCLIKAGKIGTARIVNMLMNADVDKVKKKFGFTHDMNDMFIFQGHQENNWQPGPVNLVGEYSREGWDTAILVHYPHGTTPSENRDTFIQNARKI